MVSFKNLLVAGLMTVGAIAAPAIDVRDIEARNAFTKTVLRVHNELRAKHGSINDQGVKVPVAPLQWDDELAVFSLRWTNNCATPLTHSGEHAENAYAISLAGSCEMTEKAINGWYSEIDMYNYAAPGYSDATGHFTQVIWADATKVGCAWSQDQCGDGMWHFFCDYDRGNLIGSFETEVKPLLSQI